MADRAEARPSPAPPPPRDRGVAAEIPPESEILRHRQRRLHRVEMAEIMAGRGDASETPRRRLRAARCPPAAGSRPATTRSSVDLPAPFGPVTMSASPSPSEKPTPEKTGCAAALAAQISAISRIVLPVSECRVAAACGAAKMAIPCLELFQEFLYMRAYHASGRRGNQFAPNQRRAALNGSDAGNGQRKWPYPHLCA